MLSDLTESKIMQVICRVLTILCLDYLLLGCNQGSTIKESSTAFFYSKPIPEMLLDKYDRVVVEYENIIESQNLINAYKNKIFIYISVGEGEPWRSEFSDLSPKCFYSYNDKWGSYIANIASKEWHEYIIQNRIKPAWDMGIRGFFLDTLDSYMGLPLTQNQIEQQNNGLVELFALIHERFPGIQVILNRGFHMLSSIKINVVGVAAESLYLGWDQGKKEYYTVSDDDRNWLLAQLEKVKKELNIPVTVIDYANLADKRLANATAQKIMSLGFSPWITSPYLDAIGVGAKDVQAGANSK